MPLYRLLESTVRAQRAGTPRFAVTCHVGEGVHAQFDYAYIREPDNIAWIDAHLGTIDQTHLHALYQRARSKR